MVALRVLAFVVACLGLGISAAAADGDVKEGERIARESCSRCHNVEPKGPFKLHPPSFASIAVYRSVEQIRGRIIFPPLHASMPEIGYMLSPRNVDHVVAYITSLEPR
jgi:mono/diheme cytochrome c family protein